MIPPKTKKALQAIEDIEDVREALLNELYDTRVKALAAGDMARASACSAKRKELNQQNLQLYWAKKRILKTVPLSSLIDALGALTAEAKTVNTQMKKAAQLFEAVAKMIEIVIAIGEISKSS